MKKIILLLSFLVAALRMQAAFILITMDETQKNHLKAYGVAYMALQHDIKVQWLLNYKAGVSPPAEQPADNRRDKMLAYIR